VAQLPKFNRKYIKKEVALFKPFQGIFYVSKQTNSPHTDESWPLDLQFYEKIRVMFTLPQQTLTNAD